MSAGIVYQIIALLTIINTNNPIVFTAVPECIYLPLCIQQQQYT